MTVASCTTRRPRSGVELALFIPVLEVLQVRAGVSLFSHASQTQLAASGGLTLHL